MTRTEENDPAIVKETPLPFWQIASVSMVQLSEACNVTVLFPFMAFMVEDMGYSGSRLGYYVGGLAAAFCGAQFCSSILWGMISDRYGRKVAIISGTLGAACGMLVFGTAKVYSQAIAGRIIGGFLCGNVGVLKSFLTEITDDTNRGKGFSYMSVNWSIGCLIAPLAGGLLSNPAEKYPHFFSRHGLFGYYPYLLPCLMCVCISLSSVILCSLFMVETLKRKPTGSVEMVEVKNPVNGEEDRGSKKDRRRNVFIIKDEEEDITDEEESIFESSGKLSQSSLGSPQSLERTISNTSAKTDSESSVSDEEIGKRRRSRRLKSFKSEEEIVIDDSDEICCADFTCYNLFAICYRGNPSTDHDRSEYDSVDTSSKHGDSLSSGPSLKREENSLSVLRRRGVVLSVSSYGLLAMGYILFDETIPLFLKLDREQGGFSFDSGRIGTLISISAGVVLIFTTFALPYFAAKSKRWLFEVGIVGAIPLTFAWPALAIVNSTVLVNLKSETMHLAIMWGCLLLINIIKNIFAAFSFTAVMIEVNHSVEEEYLGAVNGLGQSLAALARAIGPALGGMLWSFSVQYHFIFLNFIGVVSIFMVCGYVNRLLPPSIDFKKKKPNDAGNSHEEENLDAMEMMGH